MRLPATLILTTCFPWSAESDPHSQGMDLNNFNQIFDKAFNEQMQQGFGSLPGPVGRQMRASQGSGPLLGGGDVVEVVSLGGPMMPEPEMMRGLFPGPLHIEFQGAGSPQVPAMPFQEPDPLVMDMLSNVNAVMQDVIPEIHRVQSASSAPASCHQDLSKHCSTARSQIHCLGQHSEDVSETCKKDVGRSVPFVCSSSIDKFCDVMQIGILDCLRSHTGELKGDCLDCVLATSKAISKLNSAGKSDAAKPEASLLSTGTGAAAPWTHGYHFGGGAPSNSEQERSLDSKLGVLTTKAPSLSEELASSQQQAQAKLNEDAKKLQSLVDGMAAAVKNKLDAKVSESSLLMPYWKVILGSVLLLAMAFVAFGSDKGMRMISSWSRSKGPSGMPLLSSSGGMELRRPVDEELL